MSTGGLSLEVRRAEMHTRRLHAIVQDTRRTLVPVADIFTLDPDVAEAVHEIGSKATRQIALVVLGQDCNARARLVNALLGSEVLPTYTRDVGWRWIRLQYGPSKQVHLNLGNSEFEIVEPLVCHHKSWDTLPIEDLKRRDPSDLNTIMDVELNNAFLKDGLKIIIPPDIGEDLPCSCSLMDRHKDFYKKRASILKSIMPIFMYALSSIGPPNLSPGVSLKSFTNRERSDNLEDKEEEVFEKINNLYYMKKSDGAESETCSVDRSSGVCDLGISLGCNIKLECEFEGLGRVKEGIGVADDLCTSCSDFLEYSVFSMENLMDLKQVNDIHPNSQIQIALFADSQVARPKPRHSITSPRQETDIETEATESTEDVLYRSEELPESDRSFNGNFDSAYRVGKKNVVKERVTDRFGVGEIGFRGLRKGIEDGESGEEPVTMDDRRLFMVELLDRLEAMGYTKKAHIMKNLWFILDDTEIMRRHAERQVAAGPSKTKVHSRRRLDFHPDERTSFKKSLRLKEKEPEVISTPQTLQTRLVECFVNCIRGNLLVNCTRLSEIHVSLLQHFILVSFDMAREMQVVPKRIQYVAVTEQQLYLTLHEKFSDGEKKEELLNMMKEVLLDMKVKINSMDWRVDDLPCHDESIIANSVFYSSSAIETIPLHEEPPAFSINQSTDGQSSDEDAEEAVSYGDYSFGEYDIIQSPVKPSDDVTEITVSADCKAGSLVDLDGSGGLSPISFIGSSLRSGDRAYAKCTSEAQVSIKQASLDIQKTVLTKLGDHISGKLVKFVDCLRDSYYGTLQRCLESLESACRTALERPATEAMRQLLTVTQAVDLQNCASFSVLRTLMEHLRRLFYKLSVVSTGVGSGSCCVLSPRWRRQVALDTVQSLSAGRLARIISLQILERLRVSHERYQAALATLEAALAGQLHHTEDVKLAIRKKYAPGFARLCLESTSMCDLLKYGSPELGSEIGRGQYGVVYSCKRPWAGHEPCAVKSVMPADERHFNELAMEFFYTRSIPPHERIVRLWGSVVETTCGGGGPAVLLVSERLVRDLYYAVRHSDLSFSQRMRVAVDIVEGIRYLHSLGLIHRDIKMKNVLLDARHRAKLTDLGFCVPEALMSGSVVGTPIHMAPELLSGEYDGSVDVYAFGILFWYVCAGHVNLPSAFEVFQNKEQLWSKVRKGLRPERLPQFRDECWNLMQSCWAAENTSRPLLGDVQPVLERILQESIADENWQGTGLKQQNNYSNFMTDMLEL